MSEVRAVARRSYPASETSGGQEETPRIRGHGRLGGDTLRPRSGAAGRSCLSPNARGGDPEEPPRARGQGRHLGRATHTGGKGWLQGGATQERWLRRRRKA